MAQPPTRRNQVSRGPVSPAEYGEGFLDDTALEEAGYAAGLDVWDQVDKAYGNYLGDGALANSQLWSLREAIRAELLTELGAGGEPVV
jgi:hypothetical protein